MKTIIPNQYAFVVITLIGIFISCDVLESPLEDYPKDQYSTQSLIQDRETMLRVLYGAYNNQTERSHTKFGRHDLTTDYMIQKFGHFNNQSQIYQDFAWNSLHNWLENQYTRKYLGINFANLVLDNIDKANSFESQEREVLKAEARYCRAFLYNQLYDEFGPVPLVTSSNIDDYQIARAGEEELVNFIQTELELAAQSLPLRQEMFGRATKGAALGVLCKFLLNQRKWDESAEIAQEIIDLGIYKLYPDYIELFHVSSEPNTEEFIYAWSYVAEGGVTHFYIGDAYPPYDSEVPPNVTITAAQWYTADWLVNSFEKNDRRKDFFKTKYFNTKLQDTVILLGENKTACMKFTGDPNAIQHSSGCDEPIIRYADILLSRAEALNEKNGLNQESVDQMNEVRKRAGASEYDLKIFTSKEQFRDTLLLERIREFYFESKRREDLIRHDLFITNAQLRGKNAKSYHVRFPIPQAAIDANPLLTQNEGY